MAKREVTIQQAIKLVGGEEHMITSMCGCWKPFFTHDSLDRCLEKQLWCFMVGFCGLLSYQKYAGYGLFWHASRSKGEPNVGWTGSFITLKESGTEKSKENLEREEKRMLCRKKRSCLQGFLKRAKRAVLICILCAPWQPYGIRGASNFHPM